MYVCMYVCVCEYISVMLFMTDLTIVLNIISWDITFEYCYYFFHGGSLFNSSVFLLFYWKCIAK